MNEHIASTYGDRLADVYDEWFDTVDEAAIDRLAELSEGGRALELGIGTGRVALPLVARGIEVHGIDASEAMVATLRRRPGAESINVTMGNFADVQVAGEFRLIFVVFNTFFGLVTQEDQVRCFQNVAAHMGPDGTFVVEVFVPDMKRFTGGQELRTREVTTEHVSMQASLHDPVAQRVKSQYIVFSNNQVNNYPVEIRYCWPSELDLMSQLAGLRLRHRWSNWNRSEFNATSEKHISIYERAG